MITYKQQIKNINRIIMIESAYIVAHATNRQFINEINEYTICVIRMYTKRCENNCNDDIVNIYIKHIKEKEKEYFGNIDK